MHCEPASSLIKLLGGLTEVSQATGVTLTTVQRWRLTTESGGTGGHIPRKYHSALIDHARGRGIELPPAAFVDVSVVPVAPQAPDPATSEEAAA